MTPTEIASVIALLRHVAQAEILPRFKHLAPADFPWRRRFQVTFPFTAKLTIYFPNDGRLNILNTASPISARARSRGRGGGLSPPRS